MLLPLNAWPPSLTPICLLFALAGSCITSHCVTFATHPLYMLPPLNAPAGCSIASCCAVFATHPLDVPPPLNTPAGCSITSHCAASTTLSASLPLNVQPPPPTSICLLFAPSDCHIVGIGIGEDCKQYPFYWGKDKIALLQTIQDHSDVMIPCLFLHHSQTHIVCKLIYLHVLIRRIARNLFM
jgi:hypothetical protein